MMALNLLINSTIMTINTIEIPGIVLISADIRFRSFGALLITDFKLLLIEFK